ncbi:hypothetical protein NA78x_006302 [Anatilimnocola sp. NA78]|uniref:hypothetical protein n=1 Tax=Anatilimnocola sp. NA78 TaxID=3415683 RepID=UPI003CE5390D
MKLLIHCEEVFDILTRGPFPSGNEHDEAVEHHLRCCHDCRQLAEALRPAVELFHECLSAEEVDSLPEYHGNVTPLTKPTTRRLPREIAEVRLPDDAPTLLHWDVNSTRTSRLTSRPPSRWSLLLPGMVGIALTAAVVLALVGLGSSMRNLHRPQPGMGGDFAASRPAISSQDAAQRLVALQLPAACWLGHDFDHSNLKSLQQQVALALEKHEIACCTRCHSESNPNSPHIQQVATLQKSCLACHKG